VALENESYEIVNTVDILQGDFIENCPNFLISPTWEPDSEEEVLVKIYKAVVLTNSCDIVNEKIDNILVAPVEDIKVFAGKNPEVNIRQIIQNKIYRYCHLPPCLLNSHKSDGFIVDFSKAFSVPREYFKSLVASQRNRLRVRPPYREHLSHRFGESISRVALPQLTPRAQ